MATLLSLSNLISSTTPFTLSRHHKPPPPSSPAPPFLSISNSSSATQYPTINHQNIDIRSSRTSGRGALVITRAGPTPTSYIFAFVLPLSLLAVTIFAASRVADKLDQKFLEELAVNEEILEAEGNDDNDGNGTIPRELEPEAEPAPATSRSRNRPKREVESSST